MGGHGYGIGRQRLLDILVERAKGLGVRVEFESEIENVDDLREADLIVACDGVNSRLRELRREQFRTDVVVGRNRYIWLGTSRVFDAFTFAFVHTDAGWIWSHAYGFDGSTSTFIVECSPDTWTGLGFDTLDEAESIRLLETLFERHLQGHPLKSKVRSQGGAPWLNFRTVTNENWDADNIVLMGDAAHTTHFTIGSGTRLALEDAISLRSQAAGGHESPGGAGAVRKGTANSSITNAERRPAQRPVVRKRSALHRPGPAADFRTA